MTNILSQNQITTKIAALVGVVALVVVGLFITSSAQAQTQQRTFNEEWEIRDFVNSLNRCICPESVRTDRFAYRG